MKDSVYQTELKIFDALLFLKLLVILMLNYEKLSIEVTQNGSDLDPLKSSINLGSFYIFAVNIVHACVKTSCYC